MQKIKHRIIIDSLLKGNHAVLLFSQELLEEFIEVVQRPKFKRYFSRQDIKNLLAKINTKAEFIIIKSHIALCRDPKDNFLLALAKDGKASYIITGDKDLLVLKKIGKTEILTITDYFSIA